LGNSLELFSRSKHGNHRMVATHRLSSSLGGEVMTMSSQICVLYRFATFPRTLFSLLPGDLALSDVVVRLQVVQV